MCTDIVGLRAVKIKILLLTFWPADHDYFMSEKPGKSKIISYVSVQRGKQGREDGDDPSRKKRNTKGVNKLAKGPGVLKNEDSGNQADYEEAEAVLQSIKAAAERGMEEQG